MKRAPGEYKVPLVTKGSIEQLASQPIVGFNGYNGTGKSIAAVICAQAHLEAGRTVLSTMRLQDYANPRPCADNQCTCSRHGQPGHLAAHPLWEPFTDWRQLFGFRDGYVLLDEATGVADAREKGAGMPVQINNYLPQLRRKNVFLGWTTIDWRFADARLRRISRVLVWATGHAPVYADGEVWGRNRWFLWRAYDARGIGDDFDPSTAREGVSRIGRYVYVRGQGTAQLAYDTLEDVLTLGQVDEAGMCVDCGGQRSRPRCDCRKSRLVPPVCSEDQLDDGETAALLAGVPAPAQRAGVRAEKRARRRPATAA